jgi:hypothetical protein
MDQLLDPPEPVEITWDEDGIEVIWACDVDWIDSVRGRRAYMRGE